MQKHAEIYNQQIQDMVNQSVACKLTEEELKTYRGPFHYISHHEVLKPDSKTTPVRIYDLDLFNLNTRRYYNLSPLGQSHMQIHSRYFSPHSFRDMKTKQLEDDIETTFSVFHNNVHVISLNLNLENLQTHLLYELDFHFNFIGVTETKITNSNLHTCNAKIPG